MDRKRIALTMIEGVHFTKLEVIDSPAGAVRHFLKSTDDGFEGFGEAYFSEIAPGVTKSWRKHCKATSNLTVPAGQVTFFVYGKRTHDGSEYSHEKIILSPVNYGRLTISPGVWFAMRNDSIEKALVLNISDCIHKAEDSEKAELSDIGFPAISNL